jgi:hypothetical protein
VIPFLASKPQLSECVRSLANRLRTDQEDEQFRRADSRSNHLVVILAAFEVLTIEEDIMAIALECQSDRFGHWPVLRRVRKEDSHAIRLEKGCMEGLASSLVAGKSVTVAGDRPANCALRTSTVENMFPARPGLSTSNWFFTMPLLFSYGMLQQATVQQSTFGRLLKGEPDELIGFEQSLLKIEDPDFVAASGKAYHAVVKFNGRNDSRVSGIVFEVTDSELASADAYEPTGYKRITAMLASGRQAWVYAEAGSS